jgi:23S rRNA pseudouridine2605 synthase
VTEERLQKILARAGVVSRRRAEDLIRQGRVTVNGRAATLGEKADVKEDAIKVDGKRIKAPDEHRYLLLNKPKGYLTTRSDPHGRPTVYDLIPSGYRKALVSVGRLDFDTEGLILMTDDGDFAHQVAHPRYGCLKTYEVKIKGSPDVDKIRKLRRGLTIGGKRTRPAGIRPFSPRRAARKSETNSWWRVELGEGKTRQIREMFFRIGHPVLKLRRVAIGNLSDSDLPRGAFRELSRGEVVKLARGVRKGSTGKRT